MARRKIKLQWIANYSARKATYKKRVQSLMKSVWELCILCGVQGCVISYSPYHQRPELWPPSTGEIEQILADFRTLPEDGPIKKNMNQESYTSQRIVKAMGEVAKQQIKNRKDSIEILKAGCLGGMPLEGFDGKDLFDLISAVDKQLEAINGRINLIAPQQAAMEIGGLDAITAAVGPFAEFGGVLCVDASPIAGVGDFAVNGGASEIETIWGINPVAEVGGAFPIVAAFAGVGDIPANGAFPGVGASEIETPAAAQKTSLELALEALESEIPMKQQEGMGDGESLLNGYEISDISLNPYIP